MIMLCRCTVVDVLIGVPVLSRRVNSLDTLSLHFLTACNLFLEVSFLICSWYSINVWSSLYELVTGVVTSAL